MNLTLTLGTTREELIEKLAKYRYYSNNPTAIPDVDNDFFRSIAIEVYNGTVA